MKCQLIERLLSLLSCTVIEQYVCMSRLKLSWLANRWKVCSQFTWVNHCLSLSVCRQHYVLSVCSSSGMSVTAFHRPQTTYARARTVQCTRTDLSSRSTAHAGPPACRNHWGNTVHVLNILTTDFLGLHFYIINDALPFWIILA